MPNSGRFYYVVRQVAGRWEVTFGDSDARFVYESCDEAVNIARGAARAHWETRQQPSGVRVEDAGEGSRVVATFGPERTDAGSTAL